MTCYLTSCMTCHESCRKSCANQAISRPRRWWRAGGSQRNSSAADSLRRPDSGAPHSSSLNQPLLVASDRLDAQRGQQSGLPLSCSKHSVVAGWATAITAALRSLHSLHSMALDAVFDITWFENACANNQSQAFLLLS